MIKIYIDGWFLTPPLRGIGNYIKNILLNLKDIDKKVKIEILIPSDSYKFEGCPDHISFITLSSKNIFFWYNFVIPNFLDKKENSVIYFPAGTSPLFTKLKTRIFSTIHDVSYFQSPFVVPISFKPKRLLGRVYLILSFFYLVKNSAVIFTVSNFAKYDILKIVNFFRLKKPHIDVMYNSSTVDIQKNKSKKEKIILCVSGTSAQKNAKFILKTFRKEISGNLESWKIYLVGLDANHSEILSCGAKLVIKKYMPSKDLSILYQKAYLFLFPSFYESFGIPLIEALKNNCHVLASERGASREICRENAIYFSPVDRNEFSKKILKAIKLYPQKPKINFENLIFKSNWKSNADNFLRIILKNLYL